MFKDLLYFANVVGVKWYLFVTLIGIPLITKDIEMLLCYDWFTEMIISGYYL